MNGTEKTITLVAALASNGAIGLEGRMLWHLPGELKHFKETTLGKPVVMGRKTWESIGRTLPGRQNIVVTGNREFCAEGCETAVSLEAALVLASGREIMIIGGGELYRQAMPLASRMILTLVECEPMADTWFPEWERSDWRLLRSRTVDADEHNPYAYRVQELVRNL